MTWIGNLLDKCIKFVTNSISTLKSVLPLIQSHDWQGHIRYLMAVSTIAASIGFNLYIPFWYAKYQKTLDELDKQDIITDHIMEIFILILINSLSTNLSNIARNTTDSIIMPVFRKSTSQLKLDLLQAIANCPQDIMSEYTDGEIRERLAKADSALYNTSIIFIHGIPTIIDFILAGLAVLKVNNNMLNGNLITFFSVYILISINMKSKLVMLEDKQKKLAENLNDILTEGVLQADAINVFLNKEEYLLKCSKAINDTESADNAKGLHQNKTSIILNLVSILNVLLFRIFSFRNVVTGNFKIEQFRALEYLLLQLTFRIEFIHNFYNMTRVACKDLKNYIDMRNALQLSETTSMNILQVKAGTVRFSNISFIRTDSNLRQQINVLDNVNLVAKSNSITALVGTNGAGKSSLMKMLLRNLVTYTGTITIDGQNIKEISINALRENVSIAMPKTTIFNESLLFNITCGKAIEEEKLSEIIKRCCLGFLLKQNSDPSMIILGKYGIKLSSGQEQLVGLARLIARNPKIVIYDEAFAQLDNETFTKIVPFLDQFNKNKTVFWIDHNLHNIEHANEIIVIDSGRIIEKGNHEELLGIANSTYKKMWLYQNQKKNLSTLLSSNNFLSQSQEKKSQNLHKNDVSMSYFLSPTYRTN